MKPRPDINRGGWGGIIPPKALSVRSWIVMVLARQDLAEGIRIKDIGRQARGYRGIVEALGGDARLRDLPLPELLMLAIEAVRPAPDAEKIKAAKEKPPGALDTLLSREELEFQVFWTARILGADPEKMFGMEAGEFEKKRKLAEAMLARFEMDLVRVASQPHLRKENARSFPSELGEKMRGIKLPELTRSPYREHYREAIARKREMN